MILQFFYIVHELVALKSGNKLLKRDSMTFFDLENKNAPFSEPKFNENCDKISLEAASECEEEFEIYKISEI